MEEWGWAVSKANTFKFVTILPLMQCHVPPMMLYVHLHLSYNWQCFVI